MIAYKFAAVFASTILGIAVAVAVAHPSAVTQDAKFLKVYPLFLILLAPLVLRSPTMPVPI